MANDTVITVVGNLTSDPNLRYINSGVAVVDFTVATTPRSFDRNTNQWKDGDTLFLRCTAWRDYAENIAESLTKGTQVIVQGRLVQRSYTPRDGGEQRTVYELQVEEVGPTLRWAKVQVQRTPRRGGPSGGSTPANSGATTDFSQGAYGGTNGGQAGDPWGAPGNTDFDQDPPF